MTIKRDPAWDLPTLLRFRERDRGAHLERLLKRHPHHPFKELPMEGLGPLLTLRETKPADQRLTVALDIETTGLDPFRDRVTWISWAIGGLCGAVPIRHRNPSTKNEKEVEVSAVVKALILDPTIITVWHNAKFDLSVLIANGWIALDDINANRIFDTMLASYVLNPVKTREGGRHGLKQLYDDWLRRPHASFGLSLSSTMEAFMEGNAPDLGDPPQPDYESLTNGGDLEDAPYDKTLMYSTFDAWSTYQLCTIFRDELAKDPSVERYFYGIEMPHLMSTLEMYLSGLQLRPQTELEKRKFTAQGLHLTVEDWQRHLGAIEQEIFTLAGRTFNLASPDAIRKVLFRGDLDLAPRGKHPSSSKHSVDKDALVDIFMDVDPSNDELRTMIAKILYWKQVEALTRKHSEMYGSVNPKTKRVHANLRPTTASGRYASPRPNVLALSSASEIKDYIVPADGWTLVVADFSQIDLRVIANESGETAKTLGQTSKMLDDVNSGADLHTNTLRIVNAEAKARSDWNKIKVKNGKPEVKDIAGNVLNLIPSEQEVAKRLAQARSDTAKPVNFGISYGLGPAKLLENLNTSDDLRKAITEGGALDLKKRSAVARSTWKQKVADQMVAASRHTMEQVREYLENFHATYPLIRTFQDVIRRDLERDGCTYNLFGRKCLAEIAPKLDDRSAYDIKLRGGNWYRIRGRKVSFDSRGVSLLVTSIHELRVTEPKRKRKIKVRDLEITEGFPIYSLDVDAMRQAFETYQAASQNARSMYSALASLYRRVDLSGDDLTVKVMPAVEYEIETSLVASIAVLHDEAMSDVCDVFGRLEHIAPVDVFGDKKAIDEAPPLAPFVVISHEIIKRVVTQPEGAYAKPRELTYVGFDKLRRNLISSRVSSTSMDVCKLAMTRFRKLARRFWPGPATRPKLVNCVHDEIAVECCERDEAAVEALLLKVMKSPGTYRRFVDRTKGRQLLVKIDAEAGTGDSYLTAKP
jgi:DNA polymerase I-like protein with 3'-5' exonuclease and polymerase domains